MGSLHLQLHWGLNSLASRASFGCKIPTAPTSLTKLEVFRQWAEIKFWRLCGQGVDAENQKMLPLLLLKFTTPQEQKP